MFFICIYEKRVINRNVKSLDLFFKDLRFSGTDNGAPSLSEDGNQEKIVQLWQTDQDKKPWNSAAYGCSSDISDMADRLKRVKDGGKEWRAYNFVTCKTPVKDNLSCYM